MGYFIRTEIEEYDGEYCYECDHLETRHDREGCTLYDKILEKKDGKYLRCPTCLRNEKECQEAMEQSQMTTELLIEELKKIEGVIFNSRYFERTDSNDRIVYLTNHDHIQITTDFRHEKNDENTRYFDNLEPETILDLFRKWK